MKKIKPCPFCGSEKVSLGSCFEKLQQVECINCGANGPCVTSANKAVLLWNFAPRKEDVEMEQNCGSCKYNLKGYCGAVPSYKSFKVYDHLCCTDWEAKEPESSPLNPSEIEVTEVCPHCESEITMQWDVYTYGYKAYCPHCGGRLMLCTACHDDNGGSCDYDSGTDTCRYNRVEIDPFNSSNSRCLEPFLEADEADMNVIRLMEPMVNRYQMAAEEAAELAQAMLKYCRVCKHGSYTPTNPKDAMDAVIEEYADLLLAMEASFPRCEGNKMFYNNLERVYREKAERWAERLKEAKEG